MLDEKHVRRRVARADLAVEVEWGAIQLARIADAELQLIHVAFVDRVFGAADSLDELPLRKRLAHEAVRADVPRNRRSRAEQLSDVAVEPCLDFAALGLGAAQANERDLVGEVIEHDPGARNQQQRIRKRDVRGKFGADPFQDARRVVCEDADGSAGERQARSFQ